MNPPLNILAPGPWDAFVPYSGLHAVAFAVCALLIAAPSLIGRTLSESAELHLRRALAAFAVCYWLTYNIWWNWHGLDPRTGLPLQICDVNGLLAPLVLLTRWRWAQATLYFWTAALTLQAFVQPALRAGPASPIFWAFWIAQELLKLGHEALHPSRRIAEPVIGRAFARPVGDAPQDEVLDPHGEERDFAHLRTMLHIALRTVRPPEP